MTPTQRRRAWMVAGILAGVGIATGLAVYAMRYSIGYTAPAQVFAAAVPRG